MVGVEGLTQRVERAGADVAVDDAERAERQQGEVLPAGVVGVVGGGRGSLREVEAG
jgi:hypothetical protein